MNMFKVKYFDGKLPVLVWGQYIGVDVSYQTAKWLYECDYNTYIKRGTLLIKRRFKHGK